MGSTLSTNLALKRGSRSPTPGWAVQVTEAASSVSPRRVFSPIRERSCALSVCSDVQRVIGGRSDEGYTARAHPPSKREGRQGRRLRTVLDAGSSESRVHPCAGVRRTEGQRSRPAPPRRLWADRWLS